MKRVASANKFHRLLKGSQAFPSRDHERNAREDCNGRISSRTVFRSSSWNRSQKPMSRFLRKPRCKISSVEGSYSCQWSFPLLFFPLFPLFFRFTLPPPLSSSIVQFTRYQVGGKIYRAPVSGIWVNGFTFYSRSRPSIRPCDFLRPYG